ncbi:hypothetical protein [Porphyromonas gulae]
MFEPSIVGRFIFLLHLQPGTTVVVSNLLQVFRHTPFFSLFTHPKDVVRELFRFGSGNKKFSRQNEKILAPFFPDFGTAIGAFLARIFRDCYLQMLAYRLKGVVLMP